MSVSESLSRVGNDRSDKKRHGTGEYTLRLGTDLWQSRDDPFCPYHSFIKVNDEND